METPTRPFTVGGRTLSNVTPASQGKKVVSFKAGVFPSPPATKTAFNPSQTQQQQGQQQQQQQQSLQQNQPSSSSSYASSSFQSSMTRSTSAPNLLPGPSTSSSSSRQVSQYQSTPQSNGKQQETPQKKPLRQTVAPVPVNSKMAIEARKAVMAKRLRLNLVLLLVWYIVTESRLYNYLAREAIHAYPPSRPAIIWILDRLLPLLLTYNASEAFLRIKYAPASTSLVQSIAEPVPAGQQPVSGPTPSRTLPISNATYKSSPKTRPSTNILPSPTLSRPRPRSTTNEQSSAPLPPSAHQGTPPRFFRPDGRAGESPTSALRRALLASGSNSPLKQDLSSSTSMPAGLSSLVGSPSRETTSPRVQAYWARHEPLASNLHHSINTRGDIDRLLASEA